VQHRITGNKMHVTFLFIMCARMSISDFYSEQSSTCAPINSYRTNSSL